jgi:hypothetical protein
VITTARNKIPIAPTIPAFPTTQGWRIYIITPRIVNVVGVKTPAKVPNVFFFILLRIN